jgi:amidohydrolase
MKQYLNDLICKAASQAALLRKELHCIPEPAGEEIATSVLLRNRMRELPVDLLPPFLKTDIIARMYGLKSEKLIVLRADIDALPMNKSFRHACGHDGHAAMLCGAAWVLSALRDQWSGTVLFVFQPGEEIRAMAADLTATGIFDTPRPDGIFALHGWPGIPENTVQTRIGTIMSAAGFFRIRMEGRGGHGSRPENALNPLPAAAKLTELLTELSRQLATKEKTIVTVCRLAGGENANVIPSDVVLEGTTRYLNDEDGLLLHRELEATVRQVERVFNVHAIIEYRTPYPPTINDARSVAWARDGLRKIAPEIPWQNTMEPLMASDDFAYFLKKAPGAYLLLGLGETWPSLHSPEFEFNDNVLATGISLLTGIVMRNLNDD